MRSAPVTSGCRALASSKISRRTCCRPSASLPCGISRQLTHLKSSESAPDRSLLLTALLADAINLGLVKMAESCPGTSYARLSWLHAWYIRDETYTAALAELTNAQARYPFAAHWG